MKQISIRAQYVGEDVVIETTSNPSYHFKAPTLKAGIRELEVEKGFEVVSTFWKAPVQFERQYKGPQAKPFHSVNRVQDRGAVVNQLV
tara:strand:+ start:157 stop:420 length:264 start_codon:yes stop_codon:yes gene_type:complete